MSNPLSTNHHLTAAFVSMMSLYLTQIQVDGLCASHNVIFLMVWKRALQLIPCVWDNVSLGLQYQDCKT